MKVKRNQTTPAYDEGNRDDGSDGSIDKKQQLDNDIAEYELQIMGQKPLKEIDVNFNTSREKMISEGL